MSEPILTRVVTAIQGFIRLEALSGVILMVAAALALLASNTAAATLYDAFLTTPVGIRIGGLVIDKPLLLWINDGLMAVFFLLVGLEMKREILEGELASLGQAALPGLAAIGGMVVPAAIFLLVNIGSPENRPGWAIPTATDIAFALGVLALMGRRVPSSLKIFLVALAIFDDLGAIIIIALFYTSELTMAALAAAALVLIGLFALNLLRIRSLAPYVILGIVLWVCMLKSGVHATLAGVVTAMAVPLKNAANETEDAPLRRLEHRLHPWVAFAIMPLFGFANAGVSFAGTSLGSLTQGLPLGILLGLFAGKQLGAFGMAALAIRLGWARLPEKASSAGLYGTCLIAGIGFTMSLFIGSLAFEGPATVAPIRLGVLAGSLLSAIAGVLVLAIFRPDRPEASGPEAS